MDKQKIYKKFYINSDDKGHYYNTYFLTDDKLFQNRKKTVNQKSKNPNGYFFDNVPTKDIVIKSIWGSEYSNDNYATVEYPSGEKFNVNLDVDLLLDIQLDHGIIRDECILTGDNSQRIKKYDKDKFEYHVYVEDIPFTNVEIGQQVRLRGYNSYSDLVYVGRFKFKLITELMKRDYSGFRFSPEKVIETFEDESDYYYIFVDLKNDQKSFGNYITVMKSKPRVDKIRNNNWDVAGILYNDEYLKHISKLIKGKNEETCSYNMYYRRKITNVTKKVG